MKKLLEKIWWYTLNDALKIEASDRQFIAIQKLYESSNFEPHIFFSLILWNATVGYLLSSTGEDYWEEFSEYFKYKKLKSSEIIQAMQTFLPLSKGNKRLNNHKNMRLKKLWDFHNIFLDLPLENWEDFSLFHRSLCKHMKQKSDAKTITFTIKMLAYAARIIHKKDIVLPFEIEIPIDSRLTKMYICYNTQNINIKEFYKQLSDKMKIPPIHLDGILWTKYSEIMSED